MTYTKAMNRIEKIGNLIPVANANAIFTSKMICKKEKAINLIYKIADAFNAQENRDNFIDIIWGDYDEFIMVNDLKITLKSK